MATGVVSPDTLPPAHLDSDAAKFYEVVECQIVIAGFRVPSSTLFGRKNKPKRQPKAD
jgi:hypothetical protein